MILADVSAAEMMQAILDSSAMVSYAHKHQETMVAVPVKHLAILVGLSVLWHEHLGKLAR